MSEARMKEEKEARKAFKKLSHKEQLHKVSKIKGAVDVFRMYSYKMEKDRLNRYLHPFYYEVADIMSDYRKNIDLYTKEENFIIAAAIGTVENSKKIFDMNDIVC